MIYSFPIFLINTGEASTQEPENITDNLDALNNEGDALFVSGQYEKAIEYYDKVLAIEPNDVYALTNKGALLGS